MKTLVLTAALVVLTTASFAQQETAPVSNEFVLHTQDVSVAIYPNSTDVITLIFKKEEGQRLTVRVTDSDEKVLYKKRYNKINSARVKYDINEFPAGEYFVEVLDGNDILYTRKFTKRENTLAMAQ